MTLPIVDTPLAARPAWPNPRGEAWNSALTTALYQAPGIQAIQEKLAAPDALVVTTGQQPGLLTGPGYAISKALSARALARVLERAWKRPVIPVYWVPGDDHDFDEVASAAWLDGDGNLVHASLPPRGPDAPMTPMYRQPLGPGIGEVLDRFTRSFPDSPLRSDVVEWLSRHYRPEATLAGAYGTALAELLTPLGIACLDSTHSAVKTAAAPVVLEALKRAGDINRALAPRVAELGAQGNDPAVAISDDSTLVFVEGKFGRDRVMLAPGGFQTRRGREALSAGEAERIARESPTRLSGNVLLRPVIESAILPTVAYVAGPGELKYLALAEVLYPLLGVTRQLPVPRWSGYFVEARVTRILDKFGTTLEELLAPGNALEQRLTRASLPAGTEAALASLRQGLEAGYAPVVRAATAVDPTLERHTEAARGRALDTIQKLEKKLLQHARRRQDVELGQVTRARASLRPDGKPQERVLATPGFMARYGTELVPALAEHIASWYARALEAGGPTP